MDRTAATTVDAYLAALPDDRRETMAAIRQLIRKNLPKGYEEAVTSGMLTYQIPLERYPDTYNRQPLAYVALAAQKNYYALYLMGAYMDPSLVDQLKDAFAKTGRKMDMGKSCLRFQSADDLPLDAVGKAIAAIRPEQFIAIYEAVHPPKAKAAKSKKK